VTQAELTLTPPRAERTAHGLEREKAARWREESIRILYICTATLRHFSADDWHNWCAVIGDPHHPSQWGIAAREAKRRGIIRDTGEWVRSKRPEAAGRRIPVWEAAL